MRDEEEFDRLHERADALYREGHDDEAFACYRQLLEASPQERPAAMVNCANLLQQYGHYDDAYFYYSRAREMLPETAAICNNFGMLLEAMERYDEALPLLRRAVELDGDYADAYYNLAIVLKKTGRPEAAIAMYRRSLDLDPENPRTLYNLAIVYEETGRFAKAEESYRRSIALREGYAAALWNYGLMLLSLGRYDEGWPLYEYRYHPDKPHRMILPPRIDVPMWRGEPLHGKRVMVYMEQGYGDEIQFVRYVPMLKEAGASEVTVICRAPLSTLFATVPQADRIVGDDEAREIAHGHDFWIFSMSLPLRFGTTVETIPATIPYLDVPGDARERWRRAVGGSCRVGLVWRGYVHNTNDRHRSLPGLQTLACLLETPGVSWYSLQKGAGEDEADAPCFAGRIVNLGREIEDFADTAALVAQMDLLISVDTSAAHLAGALGVACWVLVSKAGTDWRWMYERDDSVWYPGTLRLFRQTRVGYWDDVVASVGAALEDFVAGRSGDEGDGSRDVGVVSDREGDVADVKSC